MRWRHRARITRARSGGGGAQDPDFGDVPVVAGRLVLYDDLAEVQDAGESHPRSTSGLQMLNSEATVFLKDMRKITLVQPNDVVEVTYPDGSTADGQVLFAREMDAAVLVKYL